MYSKYDRKPVQRSTHWTNVLWFCLTVQLRFEWADVLLAFLEKPLKNALRWIASDILNSFYQWHRQYLFISRLVSRKGWTEGWGLKPCYSWKDFIKPAFYVVQHEEELEVRKHSFIQKREIKDKNTKSRVKARKQVNLRHKYWKDFCYVVISLDMLSHYHGIMGKSRF